MKQIFVIGFILFSLSPCNAKEILLNSVFLEYSKPINSSKTRTIDRVCHNSNQEATRGQAESNQQVDQKLSSNDRHELSNFVSCQLIKPSAVSKKTSGNSPPKYILYKRLKISAA